MATLYAKGQLSLGDDFRHQGILGTMYTGRLLEQTQIGDKTAVIPSITGSSWITAISTLLLDESDPFPEGFTDDGILIDMRLLLRSM